MIMNSIGNKSLSVVITFVIIAFLVLCNFPDLAQGNNFTGLWVGMVTLNGVSQVNRATPDLSFDLGLTGFKDAEVLISQKGSGWAYNKTDALTASSWQTGADNSTSWTTPKGAPFYAYQTGSAITDNQQITTYFRKTFQAGDTATYENLTLRVWITGGVALYLNGTSVLQENLSGLENDSPALSETEGIRLYEIDLPKTSLYTNTHNILAAALHSAGTDSAGIFFGLELVARTMTGTDGTLVPAASSGWNYEASGADPGPLWESLDFDDSSWTSGGNAPFYQHKQGTAMAGSQGTAYFRQSFQVSDKSLYKSLRLRVWRDDGIVVYLNGQEVYRNNMPWGVVAPDTMAIYDLSENQPIETTISSALLETGANWVAAEVHSSGEGDNDIYFDIELTASIEEVLVSPGAYAWKFTPTTDTPEPYDSPQPDYLGRTWTEASYNDFDWAEGQAEFGFGDGGEKTVLGYNTAVWPRTIYFRHTFKPYTYGFDYLQIQLLRDDSAVVYVNGTEIMRSNLPSGIIENTSSPVTAVGSSEESEYIVEEVDLSQYGSLLNPDKNIIAVEVHQHLSELNDPEETRTAVTHTPANLDMRVILHCDGVSDIRLLKEVYQMYRMLNNSRVPVLLLSDILIPNFEGPGWRMSSIGFDFEGSSVTGNGSIGPTGQVSFEIELPANHPTNPFLHRYHPDHDNWDARYEKRYPNDAGAPEEAFKIDRSIQFTFEEKYPPGCEGPTCRQFKPPGWGYSIIGGAYTEVIKGLHRDNITVTGSFRLERVSTISQLEQ